ncbi:MAG TPA: flavin reductase family protein [Dehalococcoidia bacterium]|nr:flavin reductase family protein [Dehalococcoidia bacterium]
MFKVSVESVGDFYQHYPKVAAIITVNAGGKKNAMAAAWHSAVSFEPPLYGVSIAPKRFTYQLIAQSKAFGVNFVPFEVVELVASVGGSDGKEVDKFGKFGIAEEQPLKTSVPILRDAYTAYECELLDSRTYGDHVWVVGEIVAVHFAQDVLTAKGTLDLDKLKPALYLGGELYATADSRSVRFLDRRTYGRR